MNENLNEKRNVVTNNQSPEILTNNIYTPAFLREQLGKLVRVEFLIGTNSSDNAEWEDIADMLRYFDKKKFSDMAF